MSQPLYQGDPRWGQRTVGKGPQTFGLVGCVVTAVAEALRRLGVRAGATPLDVQAAGLLRPGVWAPGSSGAVVADLCRAQLGVGEVRDVSGAGTVTGIDELRTAILDCLARGGVALAAVDYDRDSPKGDPTAEHWGCIYAVEGDALLMADPATAKVERLAVATLAAKVKWGRVVRPYLVVRTVLVFRE